MSAWFENDRDGGAQGSESAGTPGVGWRELSLFLTSSAGTVTWILGAILALRLFGSQ